MIDGLAKEPTKTFYCRITRRIRIFARAIALTFSRPQLGGKTNHLRAAPFRHTSLEILAAEILIASMRRREGAISRTFRDRLYQFIRLFRVNKTTKAPVEQCLA